MFDFITNNKKFAQIILFVICLPFAFFGINSYFDATSADSYVAQVGDQRVTPQEFASALSQRQEQLRRSLGSKLEPGLLDSQDLRSSVLDALIRQHLLLGQAMRNGILVPDSDLQKLISTEPAFQADGKFSSALYEDLLQSQGLTPAIFESDLRSGLMHDRVGEAYGNTALVSNATAEWLLRLNIEQREVSVRRLLPEQFLAQVKLAPDAARQYYDAHQSEFQVPEQARLDYLVFSIDDIASHVTVSADEVRQFYEDNHARYAKDEQRRASHILIAVDPKAGAEAKQAARAKAEQLLQQLRRNPAQFAELAKRNSQDPGSAAQGGDLGWFSRGVMVKPFDEKVFSMKPGEISDPVETQYGYHIIRLDAVKGRGFEEIKAQIETDLKHQKSMKQFSDSAEQLDNIAFEQGDSLQPAADALKLTIQHSGWISRTGGNDKLFGNAKLLQAVFSDDVLKNRRNTEVVDVGANTLVVAHVADYRPASTRPFAEVSADIEKSLARQQAAQLAAKQGQEWLERLNRGDSVAIDWSPSRPVSRNAVPVDSPGVLQEIFRMDVSKLPAYGGVVDPQNGGGYVLLKISSVTPGDVDSAKVDSIKSQLQQIMGQEESNAYVTTLKSAIDVQINQKQFEQKQQ